MTELGDALMKAISVKDNDINSFTWKHQNGKEVRLMDMEIDDLQKCYNHCTDMLWNKSAYNPGKYVIRENIQRTLENCNAELFRRWLLIECEVEINTNKELLDYINDRRKEDNISLTDYITTLFNGLPAVFTKITVDKLMSACFDKLDVLNRKMISDKFILSQGIWLTEEEKRDLTEYNEEGKMRNRLDVMKERLFKVDLATKLHVNSNGLSYAEFRALVNLDPLPKISSLPTFTLELLRDKILLLLDNDLDYHINKWTTLKERIDRVAEYKNLNLVCKEY